MPDRKTRLNTQTPHSAQTPHSPRDSLRVQRISPRGSFCGTVLLQFILKLQNLINKGFEATLAGLNRKIDTSLFTIILWNQRPKIALFQIGLYDFIREPTKRWNVWPEVGRMGDSVSADNAYREWSSDISLRFRQSQIKASIKVNSEMLRFYWSLGHDMDEKKNLYHWGSDFYEQIGKDLRKELPDVKSFSARNLQNMHQFYRLFPIAKQAVSQFDQDHMLLSNSGEFTKQVVSQIADDEIFLIPWGHIIKIMNKVDGNRDKALFYIRKTLENNWSRAVLINFLDSNLYERQGKAVSNFDLTLPAPQSDLAQAVTKDPYTFDFLTIRDSYDEKELKDALMNNITRFLLDLGNGFAFVGREYRLEIGNTTNFIDMLFYNIKLHCYVVVEIKVKEFDSGDMGQLGTYMVAVNHQLKGEQDGPTLGLLICKSKDNVKARYALEASSQPMGISQYDITAFIPEAFKGSLPTIEEIEAEISSD